MSKTEENLKLAFASESQSIQKYRAFARKARRDGYPNIARVFKLSSEIERIRAQRNLYALEAVGSTLENLKTAIAKEINENKTMYPPMLEQAISDNHKAKHSFGYCIKSKEARARLYFSALVALEHGKDLIESGLYLCPVCGNILLEQTDDICKVCGTPSAKFVQV